MEVLLRGTRVGCDEAAYLYLWNGCVYTNNCPGLWSYLIASICLSFLIGYTNSKAKILDGVYELFLSGVAVHGFGRSPHLLHQILGLRKSESWTSDLEHE